MLAVDPILIEQALFNIMDNAAKYADEGTALRIEGRKETGRVVLRLTDEGPGLPEADLNKIFDMFYRVRKTDSVRAGTGLGLAIARGFVEAMGGTLTAGNRPDARGACFTVAIPVPTFAR